MKSVQFECVFKRENDARLIFQWRNDPTTLQMSLHTQPKEWVSFYSEFCRDYFTFPDLPPLFACQEGKRVAFLRFRPLLHPDGSARPCCDISINVAPEVRSQGLGTLILQEISAWLQTQGYASIVAEIKPLNSASIKAFESAGFRFLDQITKEIFDTGEKIELYRYLWQSDQPQPMDKPVFIIAEVGSNWRVGQAEADLKRAHELIEAAAEAGVNAVKFQTYRAETIYVPNAGKSGYLSHAGIEEEMDSLFRYLAMPYELLPELAAHCTRCGVQFLSTPFSPADFAAVDPFVTLHKIASYEIGHIHLLTLAARSGKPLLLSTGAATEDEIAWAVDLFRKEGGKEVTLLQCTARYPAEAKSMHLSLIPWMKQRFQTPVGLSDHSRPPLYAPVAAVALGASVIEKHFTLDNSLPGPDHAFAVLPAELKAMVAAIRATEEMRGKGIKQIDPIEVELRLFARRGVQALTAIQNGEILHEGENIALLRPGLQPMGVHAKYLQEIEGKRAVRPIPLGHGIQKGDWQ